MGQKLTSQDSPLFVGGLLSCNKSALWHQLCEQMIHKCGLQPKGHFYSNKSWCADKSTLACLVCSEDIEFEIEDSRGSGSSLLASTALVSASPLLQHLAPSCSTQPRPQLVCASMLV